MPKLTDLKDQEDNFSLKGTREMAATSDKTITLSQGPGLDFKDIYLQARIGKSNFFTIIGVHGVGYAGFYVHKVVGQEDIVISNFQALEVWGNEYDEEHNVMGRGSFRLHTTDIDSYVGELESEGWVRREKPQKK